MPVWANFVAPSDLSLYYYLPTTSLEQTSFIGWTQPHPQPQPQPSHAALIVAEQVEAEVEVEVEAQSTRLIEISWILTFIMNTSLYRNTLLYIKANLIDLSDLVILLQSDPRAGWN